MNRPCDECADYNLTCLPEQEDWLESHNGSCGPYAKYLGYQEGLAEKDWEWRSTLWAGHGCNGAGLYGDDGELQCNNIGCGLDFKRDTPKKIANSIAESKVHQREREIVEWVASVHDEKHTKGDVVGVIKWREFHDRLEAWLKE